MHTQRLTFSILAVTGLLATAACGTESAGDGTGSDSVGARPQSEITGKHWNVESVTVDGTRHDAPAGAHIEFGKDGKVGGNYGCNHFGASTEVEGDTITVGSDLHKTEMACGDKPMEFESKLSGVLSDSTIKAEVNDGKLTLTTQDGSTVRLVEEEPAELQGTKWNVTSRLKGDSTSPLASEAKGKVHLTFDGKGTVRGQLGCNRMSAKATVSDGRITLGSPSTTRMMCSASLMDTERELLKLFDGTVTYELKHRSLTLTSENGTGIEAVAAK
ncbi:META domain-containing protein [Streptomyces montanus]|uniref:META domain-containing protein n=1 Tax=Streptomyces montanus TaxID=2580423 RepID=A0A5R9FCZ9_9ACTN|nr:META domain-containing protein [Streptomyces montanus]TLS41582.1 META domain-containing protein [Streptomyces montanus]